MSQPSFTHVVILAKPAIAGKVKTRLCPPLKPEEAAEIHLAMLSCIIQRVHRLIQQNPQWVREIKCMLCLDEALLRNEPGQNQHESIREYLNRTMPELEGILSTWDIQSQAQGHLGERMTQIWRDIGGGPVMFLGSDSPDIPAVTLKDVFSHLVDSHFKENESWVGPVADGGYWTLAARKLEPMILSDIDWGSPKVLAQTKARAEKADLVISELPAWFDVDLASDLKALFLRLEALSASTAGGVSASTAGGVSASTAGGAGKPEQALKKLRQRLSPFIDDRFHETLDEADKKEDGDRQVLSFS